MRQVRSGARFALVLTLTCTAGARAATPYTFTKIADSNDGFELFNIYPSINNHGVVAFSARNAAGATFIYTGDGGPLHLIADSLGAYSNVFSVPFINDSGYVSHNAALDSGGGGVYVSNGTTTTTIATSASGVPFSEATINNDGWVSFIRFSGIGGQVADIYLWDTSTLTILTHAPGMVFSTVTSYGPPLNDSGMLVANGTRVGNEFVAYRHDGTTWERIGPYPPTIAAFAADINDAGTVVFQGLGPAGYRGIFVGDGDVTIDIFADNSGAYSNLLFPSMNNSGLVAFKGLLDVGGEGFFTGPNAVTDKIIVTGDPLDGSTFVSGLNYSAALNDSGQFTFSATLADGRVGIFRADPVPEAGTIILSTLFAAGFVLAKRRR